MKNPLNFSLLALIIVTILTLSAYADWESCCIQPDNGTGTITLPPKDCNWQSYEEPWEIIDGLPPGTTIELDVTLIDFICSEDACINCSVSMLPGECEKAGGSLGGTAVCFEAGLDMVVRGTGELEGFNRHLVVPVFCEIHTGPRNPGDPVQIFQTDFYRLQGELFGDPDFCTLRVVGGTDNGLPSPGQMILTKLDGTYNVDSFFDITYQIEFEGCPASQIQDYSGTTTATNRISLCPEVPVCEPTRDGLGCKIFDCPVAGDECKPKKVKYDPDSGSTIVLECECHGEDECYVDISGINEYICVQPDNGTGTATLPPIGCDYTSPDEVFEIIDGLPPGTTIEMDGILMNFICCNGNCPLCTMPLDPGECETAGGSLGGDGHCFEADLDMTVSGTGSLEGFNRHLVIPVFCEIHTGPRNPGDPVQTFPTDFYRLQGELFGDPDFCTLRITGGTDFGLPGPGETTLAELPSGDYAVDSFFDITYQIEFEGCPASQIQDYSGITTATIRMETGNIPEQPTCIGPCPECQVCVDSIKPNGDGTIDISCNCMIDADLNRDGKVDFKDWAIFGLQWMRGTTP